MDNLILFYINYKTAKVTIKSKLTMVKIAGKGLVNSSIIFYSMSVHTYRRCVHSMAAPCQPLKRFTYNAFFTLASHAHSLLNTSAATVFQQFLNLVQLCL